MISRFLPVLLFSSTIFCAAETDSFGTSTMVGVLMDARCPAIRNEVASSSSRAVVQTHTIAKSKKSRRTGAEGTRSRTADDGDKYEACKVTAETTDFALHTDGRLHVLDEQGNEVVRQQIRNESFRASLADESGAARWVTVMVEARTAGDKLTVTSLRR